jgi:bifunctional pyridoxal-dependent enzyme with beta-cystathionase and maltose regulon repressor activities
MTTLGMIVNQAAYAEEEPYLNQLVDYLDGNHNFRTAVLPDKNAATDEGLERSRSGRIWFGWTYGLGGENHMRTNIGTSRKTLEAALNAMADAVKRA